MDKGSKRVRRRSEEDDKSNDVIMNEHQGAVDDDIMLKNRDVITGVENGLLGKRIGLNALWNKICSLWKLSLSNCTMYKESPLRVIGNVIGQVMKIDYNTNNGAQGRFARMAATIDLSKSLVSKVPTDGKLQ
ncbi:hypothetical protein Golax_008414 [Gossypium laxum]|uniref:Uncharacterized protein n=1 Tax=Gossypium laxum TaxID=34288 RepID=A0A7J9AAD0_9ROSI|nr:hypothetical protein [Gossypium laxum]